MTESWAARAAVRSGLVAQASGPGPIQNSRGPHSQKLDVVLAAVELIGDSLERARTLLEAKIDKVTSDLVLLHAGHRKLADKTGVIEARVDELAPTASRLKSEMEDLLARVVELEHRVAWEWLESTGSAAGCTPEQNVPVLRRKRDRARCTQKRGEVRAGPVACAPDLEQLIQERREAIHSAAAISASPVASKSETEISQPPSDQPITPDRLSELGLAEGPPVMPATAD
ncbi:hypothetical protein NDU88_003818 [Pleurodeles waltl]|uniref:Uncharacterized protein n=1 Tax=Pleurodeles waltl TaxID=8319 RepID=A0AAV7KXJ5_PLEWA|nr:hypothetical protein NDU88_003818 [Pleurodeles waltl]